MKRNIDKILDDYISKSDYRDLIIETEEIIKNLPETIIHLIENLNNRDIDFEWKRNQLKNRFLSYLLKLEEDTQIKITYEVIRRYLKEINIKEVAEKLCFFVSENKLFEQVLKTKEEDYLKEFNRLLISTFLLRGKIFTKVEKEVLSENFSEFDFNWTGLELDEIEEGLPLRNYTLNGGSYGFSFGLQNEEKFPYSFVGLENLILRANKITKFNDLASIIAKDYIHLIEMGDYEFSQAKVRDIESGIICHLNYQENLSESLKIAFKGINSEDVFKYLFTMSVFGGAYERGDFGATSRINSWKVISGLVQKDYFESNKKEISAELNKYKWTEFSCDNEWFINEWLDLGIIGINEDEKKYAVLVITDTD